MRSTTREEEIETARTARPFNLQALSFLVVLLLAALVGTGALVLFLQRDKDKPASVEQTSSPDARDPQSRIKAARQTLIAELLNALAESAGKADKDRTAQLVEEIAREGEDAIPAISNRLDRLEGWNLDMALLNILSKLKTDGAIGSLEQFYGRLGPDQVAYKIETARALGRCGGSPSREALLRVYAAEKDEKLRQEISKTLVAVGVTQAEIEKQGLGSGTLAWDARSRAEMQTRLDAVSRMDAKTEAGMKALHGVLSSETTIAVALAAVKKVEERGDDQAARAIIELVSREAGTNEAQIIQTNALAALCRLKSNAAREAVGRIASDKSHALRMQAISLIGAFGDEIYLPVLDIAAAGSEHPEVRNAAQQAIASLKARAEKR